MIAKITENQLPVKMLGRMAERALNNHFPTETKNPEKEAARLNKCLRDIYYMADDAARLEPSQRKAARLIQEIADTPHHYNPGRNMAMDPYQELIPAQKLGACQGSLEVLSALGNGINSRAIANAAQHVGYGDGSLKLEGAAKSHTPEKTQALFAVGLHCLRETAGFLNHQSALAIMSLEADPRAQCSALFAAGETGDISDNTEISLKLLARVIDTRRDILFRSEPVEQEPVYSRDALKLVGGLAEQLGKSDSPEALEGKIIGEIAQKALKLENCTDLMCEKKRFFNNNPELTIGGETLFKFSSLFKDNSKLTPFEEIGEYMGAFDLALSLQGGFQPDSVSRGAARLMGNQEGNHFFIREQDKLTHRQRTQIINHITKSGVEGLKVIAEAAGDQKALNLLNSIPDGHETPSVGSLTPGRILKELKDRPENPKTRRSR